MSGAKQLAYALIDALNACGIEEEFSYRFIAEMNDILRKQNEELKIENESKMLAGHNKELQDGIIMIVKEYGLSSTDALELINRLSDVGVKKDLVGASASMDEAVKESGTCEEPKPKYKVFANMTENISGDIADVMQDVYTSGEEKKIDYDTLKWNVQSKVESPKFRKQFLQVIDEHEMVNDFLETLRNKKIQMSELHNMIDEYEYKRLKEAAGEKEEYTSGEDPGDTHEPKLDQETKEKLPKGTTGDIAKDTELIKSILKQNQDKAELTPPKETINYDALISAVAGHLDVNDWSEFNRLIKEHKELTLPMVYGTPKKAGPFGYVAPIGEPLNEHKNVQLFPPVKMAVPGESELVDVDTIESETREYQRQAFEGMNITFKDVDTEKIICVSNIDATLIRCNYLSKGIKVNMAFDPQQALEMYNIVEIVQKKNPVRELVVLVKELKKYD